MKNVNSGDDLWGRILGKKSGDEFWGKNSGGIPIIPVCVYKLLKEIKKTGFSFVGFFE